MTDAHGSGGASHGFDLEVGQTVLVDRVHPGVIRFIGTVQDARSTKAPRMMVGVELKEALGSSDGSIHGVQYFKVPREKGVFVKPHRVIPADNFMHDSENGEGQNSRTWNKLDSMNEQLSLQRSLQFQTVFGDDGNVVREEDEHRLQDVIDGLKVESNYEGPHLNFPLTTENVLHVLEHFKEGRKMHSKYLLSVTHKAYQILSGESNVQQISIGQNAKLTVVGDLHGQLQDLYSIFTINGLPGPDSLYLFNGDFVDRGPKGVEVLMSILLFKLLFPKAVFLNRGNHETRQQNRTMGFEEEVLEKYEGPIGRTILTYVHALFDQLPLCAIAQEKIFVVHGGLFSQDGVSLEHIKGMNRKREPPIHSPVFEDMIYEAMLWSDPREMPGRHISSRGAGIEFGEDVTHEFLRTNRMALVIRSHECVHEGFLLMHSGRLITLFSASRYCGLQTNKGAFLTIGESLQPEIQQFYAHALEDSHWEAPSTDQLDARLEQETIAMIVERIVDAKPSLYWHYTRIDSDRKGVVSVEQWAQGLKLVLQLDLPYLHYQSRLADAEEDGSINYTKFLERYRVEIGDSAGMRGFQDKVVHDICEQMYEAMGASTLDAAFDIFDADKDGFIEYDEFMRILKQLDIGLSDAQVFELMRSLDTDADGKIDPDEFKVKFDTIFARHQMRRSGDAVGDEEQMRAMEESGDAHKILVRIGALLVLHSGSNLRDAFQHVYDFAGGDSKEATSRSESAPPHVSKGDLFEFLVHIGAHSLVDGDTERFRGYVDAIDADADGCVSWTEFERAFSMHPARRPPVPHHGKADWQNNVLQQMANFFFQNRAHLASTFRSFDSNNDGQISAEEWMESMLKINSLFKKPLTEAQIMTLMTTLDRDGDGTISFVEFLTGFRIVDSNSTEPG